MDMEGRWPTIRIWKVTNYRDVHAHLENRRIRLIFLMKNDNIRIRHPMYCVSLFTCQCYHVVILSYFAF